MLAADPGTQHIPAWRTDRSGAGRSPRRRPSSRARRCPVRGAHATAFPTRIRVRRTLRPLQSLPDRSKTSTSTGASVLPAVPPSGCARNSTVAGCLCCSAPVSADAVWKAIESIRTVLSPAARPLERDRVRAGPRGERDEERRVFRAARIDGAHLRCHRRARSATGEIGFVAAWAARKESVYVPLARVTVWLMLLVPWMKPTWRPWGAGPFPFV